MIKGITINLIETRKKGLDPFNVPIFEEVRVPIDDVLVAEPSSEDVINNLNLYGKRAQYTLGIPKSDTHNWEDRIVEFYGKCWRTFTVPIKGIDENVPLRWNQKVMVEYYG